MDLPLPNKFRNGSCKEYDTLWRQYTTREGIVVVDSKDWKRGTYMIQLKLLKTLRWLLFTSDATEKNKGVNDYKHSHHLTQYTCHLTKTNGKVWTIKPRSLFVPSPSQVHVTIRITTIASRRVYVIALPLPFYPRVPFLTKHYEMHYSHGIHYVLDCSSKIQIQESPLRQ